MWSAQYQTYDKTEWPTNLAETIHGMSVDKASTYIKNKFGSFGKINRTIIGHKVNPNSDNNYYMVRDLTIHFDLLKEGKSISAAHSQSIRNLDVNSLQFLIFNGVKYEEQIDHESIYSPIFIQSFHFSQCNFEL